MSWGVGALLAFGLVVAACSGGDQDGSEFPASTSSSRPEQVEPEGEPPSSLLEIERPVRVDPALRTPIPTTATSAVVGELDRFGFSDLSPDGHFSAQAIDDGICVQNLDSELRMCGGSSHEVPARVYWSPDSSRLILDEHLVPGPLVLHSVAEDGAVDDGVVLDDHQFLAWASSDSIVARVEGFLARVDLIDSSTERIGEVGSPFDAVVAGEWLWYAAAGEVTALHATGFATTFPVEDRYKFHSIDSTGQVALASVDIAGAEMVVFDALDATRVALPAVAPDDRFFVGGVLSPDGALVFRTARTGDGEHTLLVAEVDAVASGAGWSELSLVMPAAMSTTTVWLDASTFRVSVQDSVVEVRLLANQSDTRP